MSWWLLPWGWCKDRGGWCSCCRSGEILEINAEPDIHHAGPFVIPAIYAGAGGERRGVYSPLYDLFFLPLDERTGGGSEVRGDEVEGVRSSAPPW